MRTFPKHVLDEVKAVVLEHMSYDQATGLITWKASRKWAKRKNGEPLGCDDGQRGYLVIYITTGGKYRQFKAHRLAWLLHYGDWPSAEIDHINHDKKDNRICNLRCVSGAENNKNRGMRTDNSSGYTGVHLCSRSGKWKAQHNVLGRRVGIGTFDTAEAANAAVIESRKRHGFHENHGHD